jgi:tetratricopeptide (TPR) repeat protein
MMSKLRNTACGVTLLCMILAGCASSPEARRDKFLATGREYLQKSDYKRALLEFKNADRAKPNDAEVNYQIGVAETALQDFRAAIAAFNKAVEISPKHAGPTIKSY